MFEFLYILIMFVGIYFLGSIIYPILELIRICLILFRKKAIFRPGFNFFMSFILILFISIFFGLLFGALRYAPSQVTSGAKDFIGLVFVLTYCLLNFMSILKIYCNVKRIEYNRKTVTKHFIFSLGCTVVTALIPYLIIYFWYY